MIGSLDLRVQLVAAAAWVLREMHSRLPHGAVPGCAVESVELAAKNTWPSTWDVAREIAPWKPWPLRARR
jgi:hypothetical protein